MTVPFLTVKPKSVKLKVSPRFPAQLLDGLGTAVEKANGNYSINLDYADFPLATALPSGTLYTLIFNPALQAYTLIPLSVAMGGFTEAPIDGSLYGRLNATWTKGLPLAGGNLTGPLILAGDPTVALGAATRQYADQKLPFSGGTLTGALTLAADPLAALQPATKQYVDAKFPRSYLAGLTLSTAGSSATFSVAPGICTDSTNVDILLRPASIAKTTAAWSVGTGAGSLDAPLSGSVSTNTWYHVHQIKRQDTGIVDVAISLNASAPTFGVNIPAAYTLARRIGSMKTNASSQWTAFTQNGDEFLWTLQVQDVAALSMTGAAQLLTLSVPTGIQVWALASLYAAAFATTAYYLFSSPDQADNAPSISLFDIATTSSISTPFQRPIRTNTNGQIRVRSSVATTTNLYGTTAGWIDRRGRDV